MSRNCRFYDDTGEHRFDESCFPITIGGGEADISLPSASAIDGCAYVDFSDGHPFVQPDKLSRVFLNRKKLVHSEWLNDGDIIKLGHSAVRCETAPEQITFRLVNHAVEKKPVLDPPSVSPRKAQEVSAEAHVTKGQTAAGNERNEQKNGLRPFLLATFFIVLLTLVAFVFSATPVAVDVVPDPDQLDLEGTVWTVKLGNHFLAWPGEYRVQAKKKGYIPLDKRVLIGRSSKESFVYALEKLGGLLMLTSSPVQKAEVFINDRKIGKTPLSNIPVSPGFHRIVFKHPRYQDNLQEIEVEGEGKKQSIDVRLIPDWAEVEIQSSPTSAVVKVDGEDRGITPVTLELLSGSRKIRLEKDGFEHWDNEMDITAGQDLKLPMVKLSKAPGYLELSTRPKGASVVVGEQFRGRTPIKLKLKPNRKHVITLYKPGYAEVKRTVELDSGVQDQLSLGLAAEYGEIQLLDVPRDAAVFIDGKEKSSDTNEFRLSTRDHQLEIRKKGFKTFKKTVTPRRGLSQQITVKLTPLAATAETANAPKAGKSSMIYVSPGRFKMGASRREQGRRSNEVLHEVQLTRPFYIAKREVTNAEFRKFKPDHVSGSSQGLSLNGNRHPVVNVSWDDAARYSNWLSEQHNLEAVYVEKGGRMVSRTPLPNGYRLPTEAEWAWTARASGRSSPLKYPWGQNYPAPANHGNYAVGDSYVITAPVASFKSSRHGLFDIGGNVSEWMHDYYSVFTGFDNRLLTDPEGPDQGKHHVVRGSSWRHGSITDLRLSYRDYAVKPRDDLGFRVARNAE